MIRISILAQSFRQYKDLTIKDIKDNCSADEEREAMSVAAFKIDLISLVVVTSLGLSEGRSITKERKEGKKSERIKGRPSTGCCCKLEMIASTQASAWPMQ